MIRTLKRRMKSKMPVPTPGANETESAFKSRCISVLHNKDPGRPHDQIVVMCMTAWREKSASQDRTYHTMVHQLVAGPDGNFATFYIMNVTRNRLNWGVTKQSLEEALPTIVGVSLGCGPDYKTDRHYHSNPMSVGIFKDAKMPNGYALGTAKVEDPFVWGQLKSGKWGPISVVVTSYRETCSHCGDSLVAEAHPFEHACIKTGDAYLQVHSFKFKRVDLVDIPAYPQAGITNFEGGVEGQVLIPLELCAGVYESQSIDGQAPGSLLDPEGIRKKMSELTLEQLKVKVTELTASNTELTDDKTALETAKATLEGEKKTLEAKVETLENPDEDPKIKELTDRIAAMDAEKHEELLSACVEARFKAGLTSDKAVELEAIKGFNDDMLKFMTLEAAKVEAMKKTDEPAGPKSKYSATGKTDLEAAIDTQREAYGFPPRPLEAAK